MDHAVKVTAACTRDLRSSSPRHAAGTKDRDARRWARASAQGELRRGGFRPAARVARAMKHGLIVADNGSDWYFKGQIDPRWTYASWTSSAIRQASSPSTGTRAGSRATAGAFAADRCPVPWGDQLEELLDNRSPRA